MYCTKCGFQTRETDNFCSACGHQFPRASDAPFQNTSGHNSPRRLYRLLTDRKIAGVCSGLADYFGVDVTLIRLAVAAAVIFSGGIGLLAYIAAWIIMPAERRPLAPRSSPFGASQASA